MDPKFFFSDLWEKNSLILFDPESSKFFLLEFQRY